MESSAEANFRTFTTQLDRLITDCERRKDTTDLMEINVFIERIFIICTKATKIHRACQNLPPDDAFRVATSEVAGELRSLLKTWNNKRQHALPKPKRSETFCPAGDVSGDGPGRPRKDIQVEEVLHEIVDLDYTVTDVAKKYNVHRSTIYRHLKDNGIDIHQERYSDVSQHEIEEIVRRARKNHGFQEMGQKVFLGFLRSIDVRVRREDVRQACRTIDPLGTALRHPMFRTKITSHTSYEAYYAQHVWHLDGVEKLQMFAMYSYSIVDGYSTKVMNVNVAGSKRTCHAFKTFYNAYNLYGIPDIVRMDKGYENNDVKVFIDAYHQREAGIQGQSIRNVRVEKFHQYEERYCLFPFRELFKELEREGHLDQSNEADLMVLHYVFLPLMNTKMQVTVQAWNSRHSSSLNHHSPDRVWEDSINATANVERTAIKEVPVPKHAQKYNMPIDITDFNISYGHISDEELADPRVAVMPQELKDFLDEHMEDGRDDDMGKGKYIRALELTAQWIESGEGNNAQ